MKFTKIGIVLLVSYLFLSAFSLEKGKEGTVYAFGMAASFTDTIVYYTEVQALDSVKLDKHKFLPGRDRYSSQLKSYLEYDRGIPGRVCMIYFSTSKEKLEKEAAGMLNKYKKNKSVTAQRIEVGEFRFKYAGK